MQYYDNNNTIRRTGIKSTKEDCSTAVAADYPAWCSWLLGRRLFVGRQPSHGGARRQIDGHAVDIMHGVFRDFLVPDIILFGLGILNLTAFIKILCRKLSGWIMAGLALGGLLTWFWIEIAISWNNCTGYMPCGASRSLWVL